MLYSLVSVLSGDCVLVDFFLGCTLLVPPFDGPFLDDPFFFLSIWIQMTNDNISYGSLIYNYICNQCLSPLTLW
jgi:hypothetical protein